MIIPMKGRQVQLSAIGADRNVLINQNTGEMHGTHVTTYKKVDSEQFVKLFTSNIGLTFGLSAAGIKVFVVLVWAVQHQALAKDEVTLDPIALEDFHVYQARKEQPLKLSLPTFYRGLADLEKARIIAKTVRAGRYFINPNFIFNGDRIAFTTVIEREPAENPQPVESLSDFLPSE